MQGFVTLLLFGLASVGLERILVESAVMEPVRRRVPQVPVVGKIVGKILDCHQCCGFWSGVVVGLLLVGFDSTGVFACGCATSMLAPLTARLFALLDRFAYPN